MASPTTKLECDYLVVGAGTACLSFCDTILSEDDEATFVIVDRNASPGGHWNFAYPFVRLHQPSCFYGVNSVPLGRNRNAKGVERYDIEDRATGTEVLEYFKTVQEKFEGTGRVRFFMGAEYKFDESSQTHTIVVGDEDDDGKILNVSCRRKLVTVASNVTVPAMRKECLIPVHEEAKFVAVNQLPEQIESCKFAKYIVLGAGKTAVDAITHLFEHGADQSQITWIVSRDAWYFVREFMDDFYGMLSTYQKYIDDSSSVREVFMGLERDGAMGRIDPKGDLYPEIYKGAVISKQELEWIQSINNVVRLGRARTIGADTIVLDRGSIKYNPEGTLLIDCMIDQWYGYSSFGPSFTIFEPKKINLGPTIMAGNFSFSSAYIAFLESKSDVDDKAKNACCLFLRGDYVKQPSPEAGIGMMYAQSKSLEKFMKHKGSMSFFMKSRTNMNAPGHHKGGMLRMLWNMFGPKQLHRFGTKLIRKVESGGFSDVKTTFGIETFIDEKPIKPKSNSRFLSGKVMAATVSVLLLSLVHSYGWKLIVGNF